MADPLTFNPFNPLTAQQSQSRGPVGAWDEMTDASGRTRPHWLELGTQVSSWAPDKRASMASAASRMIDDLGTTFNVFSDVGGVGKPYELDSVPLVISPEEWEGVSDGLAQRIRLLDAVLADVYGPQTLMKKGLIPPDLVHSNPAYLPYVRGIQPPGGRFLISSGCDLVRTGSGDWQVLRDHTGSPNGLGQTFENRNVVSNLLDEPFDSLRVARLGGFLNLEREELQSFAFERGEEANIVFLTPGFRHPSYFEHAYKARLLGFPLVETADLTVRERRLYLKTLAGLRKIDAVVCRIDGDGIDPLEHWGGNGDGVAGLIEVWRTGNVALANAPGAGFATSPALLPFLPRICSEWFGEELKLKFVETWWLGQPEVRRRVMNQFNNYILLPTSPGRDPLLPIQCSSLSPAARKRWMATIEERPHDFVVQVDVIPSEAPSIEKRTLRNRPILWRAFTLNAAHGPVSLPGGLARVGRKGMPPQLWPHHEGFTKDVWIPETGNEQPRPEMKPQASKTGRHSRAPEVPSRIAEQLYWVGRSAERIELATRLLRTTLRSLGGEAGRQKDRQLGGCFMLISGTELIPKDVMLHPAGALKTLTALIHDPAAGGGIPALTRSLLVNAAAARDRLSDDTWRFFNRLESIVYPPIMPPGASELLRTLDTLVLHIAAFSGMQAENMTRGHGWRFLEMGRRVERALGGLRLLRTAASQGSGESSVLDPLLETCDSVMTYRRLHFSRPELDAVTDLIFFDRGNPRSVARQIQIIQAEIARFTNNTEFGLFPKIRGQIGFLHARFDDPQVPDAAEFKALISSLESFSDLLTQHFFSHSVRRVY